MNFIKERLSLIHWGRTTIVAFLFIKFLYGNVARAPMAAYVNSILAVSAITFVTAKKEEK